ncbi:MAG: hypothetical protein J5J00_10015 [Deltaproteobacteria bacterium]|nr:hypothetical protein [Deltaproteobacteria bacterium]
MRVRDVLRIIIWDPLPPGSRKPQLEAKPPSRKQLKGALLKSSLVTAPSAGLAAASFNEMSIWNTAPAAWWAPYGFAIGALVATFGLVAICACILGLIGRK